MAITRIPWTGATFMAHAPCATVVKTHFVRAADARGWAQVSSLFTFTTFFFFFFLFFLRARTARREKVGKDPDDALLFIFASGW